MNRLWIKILLAMVLFSTVANAQGIGAFNAQRTDAAKTHQLSAADSARMKAHIDSMKIAMAQPDYIIASLLVASPGFEVYSDSGHASLRLRCPSKGVDNCFEFASLVSFSSMLEFIQGTMEGGYERLHTSDYLQRYKDEGRGVQEIQLNLTPEQKLKLWAFVDKQCDQEGGWKFDYLVYDCSNMVAWAVESSLMGEKIVYHDVDSRILRTYRETSAVVQPYSPWAALFWDVMMGTEGDKITDFKAHLYPNFLYTEWQKATLVDSLGHSRKLMLGQPKTLLKPQWENKPVAITPLMVLWTLLALALLVTLLQWKNGYKWYVHTVDAVLFTIQTLLGIWIAYLIIFSHQVATDWNWLIVGFNPLAILLWLALRKRKAAKWMYALFTFVLVGYALSTPWNPQLICSHLYILLAAMAVRTAFLTYKRD